MEIKMTNWDRFLDNLGASALDMLLRIALAVLIYIIGRFLINRLVKGMKKLRSFRSIDPTAEGYIITFTKAALYVMLGVSIVALLGVPMSSVIAAIASAGVAIGMALQGALGNVAGGIMLLLFRPFEVGDYIVTDSGEGRVRSISLVYTVLTTFDNRRISVPNGRLMNSSITNATAETLRRVDLSFDIAVSEPPGKVRDAIMSVVRASDIALEKPEAEIVPADSITDGLSYDVRVWVKTAQYWDLYNELMENIPEALNAAGIKRPERPVRINS